jgi:hypothetical protein
MNTKEMIEYMKFGMKVAIKMTHEPTNKLVKLQFVSNGFIPVYHTEEADAIITDDKSFAEHNHSAGKVVAQLLDMSPRVREVANIPESDRFAIFDIESDGFGSISNIMDFLRRSPHTKGDEEATASFMASIK